VLSQYMEDTITTVWTNFVMGRMEYWIDWLFTLKNISLKGCKI
jgi:hypothetical protein